VRYNSSKASSCSELRVGIRIGFMGYSLAHKLTPLGIYLFVLRSNEAGEAQEEPVALAINGNDMSPDEVGVTEGDQVNLQITSDRPVEFHLHGYDLEEEVEPGEPGELSFEATMTGRFAIEDHDTETELGALLVQPR
jgi:hypothetical protein